MLRFTVPCRPRAARGTSMTVCIAAACEGGKQVVCATDGLLSFGGITADVMKGGKLYWINEWLFMYAGEPSQSQLILEEMHYVRKEKNVPIDREHVQEITRAAYNRRIGRVCSASVLGPLNVELDDFIKNGLKRFGKSEFARLTMEIQNQGHNFNEHMIVVGWGKADASCMIYEVGPYGDSDHGLDGVAAIGSGREIALSTMLLLGQSRNSFLPETLYAVASAKFAAEKSHGQDVGPHTSMYITEKYKEGGATPPGKYVQPDEVERLRKLWEQYGRPKISVEVHDEACRITNAVGYDAHVSVEHIEAKLSTLQTSEGRH
jgi:ATP-dependent protease HslVU (ClpYQ) peptidase subunit